MNHAGSACPPAGRIVIITIIACQIVSTLQASHGPALYHKQNSVRMDGKPFQPGEKAVALVSPEDDHDHFTPAAWKKPLSTERKVHLIRKACQDGDLGALVKLATTPGGLIHDDLRKLGCESNCQALNATMLKLMCKQGLYYLGLLQGRTRIPLPQVRVTGGVFRNISPSNKFRWTSTGPSFIILTVPRLLSKP